MSIKLLQEQLTDVIDKSAKWELSLEFRFNEDQQLDIMSLISYWSNQLKGFGHKNHEDLYQSILKEDINHAIYNEAKIGFEYTKLCFEIRTQLKKRE